MAAVGDIPLQLSPLRVVTAHGRSPRMAELPLELLEQGSADAIAADLRGLAGEEPLDFVVLERPVALVSDPPSDRDHAARMLAAWRVLEELVDAGVTRALGLANAGATVIDLLHDAARVGPVVDLVELHPLLRADALIAHCRARGVEVYALHPLGPLGEQPGTYLALEQGGVREIAARHRCGASDVVLRWCLGRADGALLNATEAEAAGPADGPPDIELSPEEQALLDGLDCGFRIDGSASTLASLYGYLWGAAMHVEPAATAGLEVGCHKVLYAPVTDSEAINRRFSFFVWRNLFNLPATIRYSSARHALSEVSKRISADLDRDGYAVTSVEELGCAAAFERVRAEGAEQIEKVHRKEAAGKHGLYRYVSKGDVAQQLAEVRNLTDAVDAYCGLKTMIDDVSVITIPGRLQGARKQQLWHSDVEDLFTVKAYTFLTDVDALSGPLDYITGSHPKGPFAVQTAELWKHSFVQDPTPTYSFQVPDELLFRHVRPDLMQRLQGPAGTVVLFDARGLHRGGHVLRGLRQAAVSSHTAPNQIHPWRGDRSAWRSLWYPFRWETNVTLRDGTTPLHTRIGRALMRRPEQHTKQ
jgi:diketogulonate reductase-like aldo/keto reductase